MAVEKARVGGWWSLPCALLLALPVLLAPGGSAMARPSAANNPAPVAVPYRTCDTITFAPAVIYSTGTRPRGATSGDFNHDGHPDMVVTDYSSRGVSVLLGNADGTFQPSFNYGTDVNPVTPAVADFNGDTFQDIAVVNYSGADVSVLLGNGDGTFTATNYFPSAIGPYGLAIGDFNEDNHADVAMSNVNFGTISVLLGNGNGTFQNAVTYFAGARPQVLATADFNGDGHLDLVTPNYAGTTVSVLRGNGNGTFQSALTYPVESGPDFVAVADLNGDNHPDLAVTHYSTNNVSVLLGNSDGSFQPEVLYPTGNLNPLFAAIGDFDGDLVPDLAVANYGSDAVGILRGNGNGTFRPVVNFPVGAGTRPVAIVPGDFNGDTHLDMFVANETPDNASVFINTCTSVGPSPTATATTAPPSPTSTNSAVATSTGTSTGTSIPVATSTSTGTPQPTNSSTAVSTATPAATSTPCSITFTDVQPTDYFYEPVRYLYCHGAVSGYGDGTFKPNNLTTRGQLAKIVALAEGWPINTAGGPHFTDVPPSNPFYGFIETAYNRGVISGYADGTFRWGNNVTRAQLCKIQVSAEGWAIDTTGGPRFSDVPPTDPFYGFIETAYNHAVISGYADHTFRPGNSATRGQISKIVYLSIIQP